MPNVCPVVRPRFCTDMPIEGATGVDEGMPTSTISPLVLTSPSRTPAIAASTVFSSCGTSESNEIGAQAVRWATASAVSCVQAGPWSIRPGWRMASPMMA
jgi:hypothetical protein